MFGERAEIAALPGLRNAAGGTGPPRGAAGKAVEVGPEREGRHELWPDGKQDFGIFGRAPEGERTAGDGEASRGVRGVPVTRERISRGEGVAGRTADDRAVGGVRRSHAGARGGGAGEAKLVGLVRAIAEGGVCRVAAAAGDGVDWDAFQFQSDSDCSGRCSSVGELRCSLELRAVDRTAATGAGGRNESEESADVSCDETATPIRMDARAGDQRGDGAALCSAESARELGAESPGQ